MFQWQTSPAAPCSQTQHQTSQATQMQLGAGGADTNMFTRIRLLAQPTAEPSFLQVAFEQTSYRTIC